MQEGCYTLRLKNLINEFNKLNKKTVSLGTVFLFIGNIETYDLQVLIEL